MQVLHPVCCDIDVHAAQLTACLRRVSDEGQITTELVDCGTTYRELIAFRPWWQAQQCLVVALDLRYASVSLPWWHALTGAVMVESRQLVAL